MKYEKILDEIYSNFKKEENIEKNDFINFVKENNTNIVHFDFDYPNKIKGTLIDQNNCVTIYYWYEVLGKQIVVFSKSNIINNDTQQHAVMYNCVMENKYILKEETIGRDFDLRKDLYKKTKSDVIIEGNLFNEQIDALINNVDKNITKKKTKRL